MVRLVRVGIRRRAGIVSTIAPDVGFVDTKVKKRPIIREWITVAPPTLKDPRPLIVASIIRARVRNLPTCPPSSNLPGSHWSTRRGWAKRSSNSAGDQTDYGFLYRPVNWQPSQDQVRINRFLDCVWQREPSRRSIRQKTNIIALSSKFKTSHSP